MLNQKDREFIKTVKRNQKPLIVCGLIALFMAIFWVYLVNIFFDKAGFISVTQQFHDKIGKIEPKIALEIKLKDIVLSNLEFEISQYRLIKVIMTSLISFIFLIISMGCFIFLVISQNVLSILKKIE